MSIGFPGCGLTIQACINSAAPGQTIVIQPSTYITSLTLNKAVSLTGVNSATVILTALSDQRVLTVTGAAVDSHVIISGLTFAGGNLAAIFCPDGCGGAIIVEGSAKPLIEHVVISNSQAAHFGGGLFADTGSNLLLRDVRVISNSSTASSGGGVYSRAPLQIAGGEFRENRASGFGGGLLSGNSLIVTGTQFVSNTAPGTQGGGLYAAGNTWLTAAEFYGNLAQEGGGLYTEAPIFLLNTRLHNNLADQGGGAFGTDVFNVQGGQFVSNGSNTDGGGLHTEGPLFVTSTLVANNESDGTGGGLFALADANLTGVQFSDNTSQLDGGCLEAKNPLTITDSLFWGNKTQGIGQVGGGVRALSATSMSGTSFLNNSAVGGGGGAYVSGPATVSGGTFDSNQCTGTACIAGGMVAATLLEMDATRFDSNRSGSLGGGLYVQGLAVISSAHFDRNHCDDAGCRGGALFAGTGLTVIASEFRGNAAAQGGGLWQVSGDALIANTLFARNSVSETGAALYLFSAGHIRIVETTIASPTVGAGAAIAVVTGTVNISDTIITSYTVGISQTAGSVNEDFNLFFGNGANTAGTVISGSHHQTGDPQFADPAGGDFHLRAGSPAINSGTDAGQIVDFEGDPRPTGVTFDIGYDEYRVRLYLPVVRR